VTYQVVFAQSAREELQRLPREVAQRILARINQLRTNPRPAGSIKLTGSKDLWRVRSGDYRVIYRADDGALLVEIMVVRHRRDAYN
jgi:mRNA interferase RelE/StbE